jgi:hypothetical protein
MTPNIAFELNHYNTPLELWIEDRVNVFALIGVTFCFCVTLFVVICLCSLIICGCYSVCSIWIEDYAIKKKFVQKEKAKLKKTVAEIYENLNNQDNEEIIKKEDKKLEKLTKQVKDAKACMQSEKMQELLDPRLNLCEYKKFKNEPL